MSEFTLSNRPRFKKLYENVGGSKGLSSFLNQFYQKLSQDPMIGFFFTGKNLSEIAEKQKNFLLSAMGIHEIYQGKRPQEAHEHLPPILKGHFDRRIQILKESLQTLPDLDENDINTWIEFEQSFRSVIVNSTRTCQG